LAVQSLYEKLFPLTTVMKQRVVDNFSGDTLDERWTFINTSGTGSGAMSDTVDGGYAITSDTITFTRSAIWFNDINQYSPTGSVSIGVTKSDAVGSNSAGHNVGLCDDDDIGAVGDTVTINQFDDTYRLQTGNNGTETNVTIGTDADTNYHVRVVEALTSSGKAYYDGVYGAVSTTNLPDTVIQPAFLSQTRESGVAHTANINYFEAYNT